MLLYDFKRNENKTNKKHPTFLKKFFFLILKAFNKW